MGRTPTPVLKVPREKNPVTLTLSLLSPPPSQSFAATSKAGGWEGKNLSKISAGSQAPALHISWPGRPLASFSTWDRSLQPAPCLMELHNSSFLGARGVKQVANSWHFSLAFWHF